MSRYGVRGVIVAWTLHHHAASSLEILQASGEMIEHLASAQPANLVSNNAFSSQARDAYGWSKSRVPGQNRLAMHCRPGRRSCLAPSLDMIFEYSVPYRPSDTLHSPVSIFHSHRVFSPDESASQLGHVAYGSSGASTITIYPDHASQSSQCNWSNWSHLKHTNAADDGQFCGIPDYPLIVTAAANYQQRHSSNPVVFVGISLNTTSIGCQSTSIIFLAEPSLNLTLNNTLHTAFHVTFHTTSTVNHKLSNNFLPAYPRLNPRPNAGYKYYKPPSAILLFDLHLGTMELPTEKLQDDHKGPGCIHLRLSRRVLRHSHVPLHKVDAR